MIGALNNISVDFRFGTDDSKTSDVSSLRKAENEKQNTDKLYAKDDEKRFDSFEHQKQAETAGTYKVTKDDDGKLKIVFDAFKSKTDTAFDSSSNNQKISATDKTKETDKSMLDTKIDENDKDTEESKEPTEEPTIVVTTFDLSAVEREIKQLKQQQQQLQQKLSSATEEQKQQIQAKLDMVTRELEKKDTDAYRNSHDNRRQYTLS